MAQKTNRFGGGKIVTTIGILGAGQLGKMLCEAAKKLGFETHVFAPDEDPIAASVATHFTQANYTDLPALQKWAASVDVITLEFENVPVAPLLTLTTPIYPSPQLLETSQHRLREKTLANNLAIATAPFSAIHSQDDLQKAMSEIGTPAIVKTCTMGYDGKGQWKLPDNMPELTDGDYIYEGFVNFEREISVIVARSVRGEIQCFEPVENVHKNHILHTTTAPANINDAIREKAEEIAIKLATHLQLVGLLAVELFATKEGDVLMNEMAPRPHNSGHWTLDGCNVSQFEQAIRAVTDMPLIKPERTAKKVVMTNLIGDDVNDLAAWKSEGAHIHIYGKKETRPARKMGHVNQLETNG